jgi:hypothetical protein
VDVGNAPIDFSQVSFPIDFPVGPPLTTGSLPPANIPVAGVCATGMSLPESHACLLPISFLPVTSMNGQEFAALNEDVVLTSDARGSLANPVSVAVSGGVIAPSTNAVISVSADPITLGQPVSLNVNMPWTGAVAPTGTVSFDLMDMNTGAQTLMATVPVSNGQATDTLTGLQVGSTEYIAYYSGDSNYQAQSSWPIVVTVVNPPGVKDFGGNNFGTLNLGTVGSATPLTITFTTAETLGGVGVLTKGTPGLDFQDAGNGTCTIGRSYSAGDTCIVNVLFKPTEPGVRYGAVVLTDSGGNPIGTGFVQGTGIGPLAAFLPGYTTTLPFVPAYPNGISVDASGNIFVADGEVYELTPGNGTYTQTEVTRGLGDAYDVAVDGGGNLYVADLTSGGYRAVYKLTPSPGGYTQTALGYGFADVEGIAVDGAGNVFVAAADGRSNNTLFELTPSQGAYTQTSLVGPEASPNGGLSSVAVDGSGNLFVTDQNLFNANVFKGTPSASGYTWTTVASFLDGPVVRVAVDAAGNVYVANEDEVDSNGFVEEEAVQPDGTYVGTKIATAENMPMGVALDGRGNLYVSGNHGITKLDFSDPPALAFAATNEGMTSSDSPQALTLANSGNAAMTLTAVSYPADFPEASGATGDCRMGSLAVNARCTLTVDFRPQAAGAAGASVPLSESVTVSASQWSAPLAIAVGGTENIPASPTFGLGGTAVTLQPGATTGNTSTVTVVPGGGFTGSVTVTAALTSQPANAEYLPTFSFGSTSPVNITGTGAGTATLTISTTAPSSSAMGAHAPGPGGWTAAGGAVLVCVLLAWIPRRRCASRWLAGLVALALVLGSATACGGGGGNGGGGGGGGGGTIVGTTPGSYMITVTGTSGSMTQTCTVTLTVQ